MTVTNQEKTIGIPRGMSFYGNYPFWHGFFDALGFKIVLSDPTTKQTMSEGSALVVTETCLPKRFLMPLLAISSIFSAIFDDGVIGYIAAISLKA